MRKVYRPRVAAVAMAASLGLIPAVPAPAAEPILELPQMEVVASPIIAGNEVDEFAGVSAVVAETQIRDLNAQDLQSALRRTPGVSISRYNPIGSFGGGQDGAIFVLGLGSSRPGGEVKTYIDGVPVMMGVFNHPLMYPGLDVVVFSQSIIRPLGESWRDLEAETLDHFEIGVRHQLGPRLHGELTAFYDEGDNRYVIDPPPPPPPRYANLGAFRIRGAELTLNAAPRDDLALFAGLTLLDTDPADLPYAPDTSVSLGANWQATPRVQLNLDAEYVSSMQVLSQARRLGAVNTEEVDGYFLLNGRLGYALPTLADASIETLLCFAAFPHFADPAQALAEMARVTRPGGEVVIAHLMSRSELRAHHGRHHAVARDLLPCASDMRLLLAQAGLSRVSIMDRPGTYIARGIRAVEPARGRRGRAEGQDRRASQ